MTNSEKRDSDWEIPSSVYETRHFAMGDDHEFEKLLGKEYTNCSRCSLMDALDNMYKDKEDLPVCASCVKKARQKKD